MGETLGEKGKGREGSPGREEAPPGRGGHPSPRPNHMLKDRDHTGWMKKSSVIKNSFVQLDVSETESNHVTNVDSLL